MQDNSFEQLAAEAASGLQSDRELYLDVKEELRAHLEEKADRFAREQHDAAECVALAKQSFGSPLDVAAELLAANRGRLRLRAALRLAFAALIVPAAILLALYAGYWRIARVQVILSQFDLAVWHDYGLNSLKLPKLPLLGINRETAATGPKLLNELYGKGNNAPTILHYWELHRNEPDGPMYYALYALFADNSHEASYVAAMRRGEQIEPQNALYNVLLANYYLNTGVLPIDNKVKKPHEIPTDDLLDRRTFELGNAEVLKAAGKPYLHTYQGVILQKRLNALPPAQFTEDYLNRLCISASVLFPYYSKFRNLARTIPGCARLLIAENRPREAEAMMDAWKPLTRQILHDDTDSTLIQKLVALAIGTLLSHESACVYDQLGATEKARDARATYTRFIEAKARFLQMDTGLGTKDLLKKSGSALGSMWGMSIYEEPGAPPPTARDLTPNRMLEHVLIEEAATNAITLLLLLALLGTLLQGALWLIRCRRAAAVPILLMPPARVLLRALALGLLLPMLLYWGYSRLPIIGGREYGWGYMWPRFSVELLLLAIMLLWLPARLLRKYIRQRCEELNVALPSVRDERISVWVARTVGLGTLALITILTMAIVNINEDKIGTWSFIILLISLALLIYGALYILLRRECRQYLSDLVRKIPLIYARLIMLTTLIALLLVVIPCLIHENYDPIWHGITVLLPAIMGVAILIAACRFVYRRRREYGLYYGTLARSLAPVYAGAILLLTLLVQPCLLYSEAYWLRHDPLVFGYLASNHARVGCSVLEAQACDRLEQLTDKALQGK